jgi:hypothetical protein
MSAAKVTNEKVIEQMTFLFTQFETLIAKINAMEAAQKAAAAAIAPKAQWGDKPASDSRPLRILEGPWRLELNEFLTFKATVDCNWEVGGNAKTGQALAVACGRSSGHAEGELYLQWRGSVEEGTVLAFWESVGWYDRNGTHHKHGIPPGL